MVPRTGCQAVHGNAWAQPVRLGTGYPAGVEPFVDPAPWIPPAEPDLARLAWEAADANVQIHGGNGYAAEYLASRLLVDARVLSIFEGANEIQAHVIARRLLEKGD